MMTMSSLQKERMDYKPKLPPLFERATSLATRPAPIAKVEAGSEVKQQFKHTSNGSFLNFVESNERYVALPLRIGVVLSGGQAPGGHNVIAGIFDAIKKIHPDSVLIGFLGGPSGMVNNKSIEITAPLLHDYRNQGGFDLLGSGRTKIETPEQFESVEQNVTGLGLNGLVIIGGDDSNTNAAFLAEYFRAKEIPVTVVGVPKTIDGDLRSEHIEISFGFDTACKVYSEFIGNVLKDALSQRKYYFFIKLMGRSASHITLECALKTHPNLALLGEEVAALDLSLHMIVDQIVEMIVKRAQQGKDYGVVLIPEGLLEFIPEMKQMFHELNSALAQGAFDQSVLSPESAKLFKSLPPSIQEQILLDRDPHGNVQVSKIETESLFIKLVQQELQKKAKEGTYKGKFNPQPLFCGYEGRSALPSNFDSNYCYTLGYAAAHLVNNLATGYMACVKHLSQPVAKWEVLGVPIYTMVHMEHRGNKTKAVIKKALVELSSSHFKAYQAKRAAWAYEDDYVSPGPIQFFGPPKFTDSAPLTI